MSTRSRIAPLLLSVLVFALPVLSQTLPLERRIYILSKTYESIPIQFAHWRTASYKPEQLDSIYQVFLKRAIETESRKEFGLLMREFIALLRNGHSWYNDNKAFSAGFPLGFRWRLIDGRWTITHSIVEALQAGDVVEKINDKKIDQYFLELAKYFNASDERARQGRLLGMLTMILPNELTLDIVTRSGASKHLALNRLYLKPEPNVLKTESKWIMEGSVAYMKVPSFNSPEFERDALQQLKSYAQAKAIIVDVRGNGGGSTPSRLTAALMNKPYRWWTEGSPMTVGLFRYYSEARPGIELNDYFRDAQLVWQSSETQPDSGAYQGKVIILADRGTGSAAEDFTVPFKDNGRALIIGEPTGGSTGQPYMFNFGDGISIGIGTKRAYMPSGAEFEGIGITPDIAAPVQRDDLYSGRDRALERAVAEATK
ncbi:MAG TPA: S41 family peptidase [Bacteroidota bacterium]|nr:S41 family peptidase [Bacteroidota bacterium]